MNMYCNLHSSILNTDLFHNYVCNLSCQVVWELWIQIWSVYRIIWFWVAHMTVGGLAFPFWNLQIISIACTCCFMFVIKNLINGPGQTLFLPVFCLCLHLNPFNVQLQIIVLWFNVIYITTERIRDWLFELLFLGRLKRPVAQLQPERAAGIPRECRGGRLPVDCGSDSQGDAEGRARAQSRYRPCCRGTDTRVPPGGATHPEFLGNSSAPGQLFHSLYTGWWSAVKM